jgi:diacylglycerol kinase family enzyme
VKTGPAATLTVMRALLVVNPAATTTTPRMLEVMVRALGSDLKIDVATTQRRWHAAELAIQARRDGFQIVLALGGDGTVNEVVNGLLADGPLEAPILGVVPGGSTNVFARSLGITEDPVEATAQILDAVREQRRRRIGLGRADDRWFTFCVGLGLDAEVVNDVEQRRARGRTSTPALYVASAVKHFYTRANRRHPPITLHRPGLAPVPGLHLAIVCNTAPWTYLGDRPVSPCPQASFDTGLDLLALRHLGTASTLRHVAQLLSGSGRPPRGRDVVLLHDADAFTLRADRPVAYQVDGDALGTRTAVRLSAVPAALDVLV